MRDAINSFGKSRPINPSGSLIDWLFQSAVWCYLIVLPFGTISFGKLAGLDMSIENLMLGGVLPILAIYLVGRGRLDISWVAVLALLLMVAASAICGLTSGQNCATSALIAYAVLYVMGAHSIGSGTGGARLLAALALSLGVLNCAVLLDGFRIVDLTESSRLSSIGSWQPEVERTVGVPGLGFGIYATYNCLSLVLLTVSLIGNNLLRLPRLLLVVLLGLNLVGAFLSQSRSLWFSYPLITAVTVVATIWAKERHPIDKMAGVLALVIGSGVTIAILWQPLAKVGELVLHSREVSGRYDYMLLAWQYVGAKVGRLLFGGGLEGFPKFSGGGELDNHFLNFIISIGLLAFLCYAVIWSQVVRGLVIASRSRIPATRTTALVLLLALVGIALLLSLWSRVTNQKLLWFLFGFAVALGRVARREIEGGSAIEGIQV